jgi:enediyne biosynthesis protein E4
MGRNGRIGIRRAALFFVVVALLTLGGLRALVWAPTRSHTVTALARSDDPPVFVDATQDAGIKFRHLTGARGRKLMPETLGAGCGFIDYNADGAPDILLVNGGDPARPDGQGPPAVTLLRNDGHGRFQDVTSATGLSQPGYGMGVCVGDVDNDGRLDFVLTLLNGARLYRNRGDGTFAEVGRAWGLSVTGWCAGAAFLDYDRDGHLDLFIARYVDWTPATDEYCTLTGRKKSYCAPYHYQGLSCRLYHNIGGRFEDVSGSSGIASHPAKGLGVLALDADEDGWADILVANDTAPNFLFHNLQNGRFREVALEAGVAVDANGRARSGMGVDAADIDNSGRASLTITNFTNEGVALYSPTGPLRYVDRSGENGIRQTSLPFLGFGACFLDVDSDGWMDLLVANGHIQDDIAEMLPTQTHAQRLLLFRNLGGRQFVEVAARSGALSHPRVARGLAVADVDRDGRPDVLLTSNGGGVTLLMNRIEPRAAWLRLRLVGTPSNRAAIGARVTVAGAEARLTRWVTSGGSYLSQNELPLTVGLGRSQEANVSVRWPSGRVEEWRSLRAREEHILEEGTGRAVDKR